MESIVFTYTFLTGVVSAFVLAAAKWEKPANAYLILNIFLGICGLGGLLFLGPFLDTKDLADVLPLVITPVALLLVLNLSPNWWLNGGESRRAGLAFIATIVNMLVLTYYGITAVQDAAALVR